jgi:hypothetical protein
MPHKGVHFFRTILITCSDLTAFINDGTYHTLYILETMSLVATTSGFWDWFFLFPRCGTLNDPLQKIWHECTWFPYWTNGIPSRSSYIRGSPLLQHFSWLLAHLCWFNPTWLLVWITFSLFEDVHINFLVDQCFMFAISNDFSCLNYVRILFFWLVQSLIFAGLNPSSFGLKHVRFVLLSIYQIAAVCWFNQSCLLVPFFLLRCQDPGFLAGPTFFWKRNVF